jgi:hypothetical protein
MTFPIWQVILFLFIDFLILTSIVAAVFFLILFFKTRKEKKIRTVDLNELDAFKNKNLQMETNITLENNKPVAPSTIQKNETLFDDPFAYKPPVRIREDEHQKMFNCQMQQTQQQMQTDFAIHQQQIANDTMQNNTNYFNM